MSDQNHTDENTGKRKNRKIYCVYQALSCILKHLFPQTENYWNKTFTQKQGEHVAIMLIMTCLQRKGKGNVLQARMGYWAEIHY